MIVTPSSAVGHIVVVVVMHRRRTRRRRRIVRGPPGVIRGVGQRRRSDLGHFERGRSVENHGVFGIGVRVVSRCIVEESYLVAFSHFSLFVARPLCVTRCEQE